ncbi:MAG: DMT family transporter [Vallitaleaceae bacterium]|jgi:drug/metabolite transporter (DMT)-like permease|nr:DMT family transporter [Vallitaleaceae bacterium]
MHTSLKGYILAVATITIWSSTFIISKVLLEDLTPVQVLVFRSIIAIIALSIIYPKFKLPWQLKEELYFLAIGAGLAFYFFFENSALQHTYSSNVSLIDSTIPLITGLLSVIIFKKKFFNIKSVLGFIIAYAGVGFIILDGRGLQGIEPIGDFFALVAAFMFSFYTILMHKVQKNYHIIALTRKVFIYNLLTLLILAIITREPVIISHYNFNMVWSLLYLGILASSLAFIMWNKAIESIGSVKTNQFIYLIPVVTTALSFFILGEEVTVIKVIGAALILSGLYLSEKSQENNSIKR